MNSGSENTDHISILTSKATELMQAGDYEASIKVYNEILDLDPEHADTLHGLGIVKYQMGYIDESIQYIGRAIDIEPLNHNYHNNIAIVYQNSGQFIQALESFNKAIDLHPESPLCYFNAGFLLYKLGNYDSAIEYYNKAIKYKPDFFQAYDNLGKVLQDDRRIDEAETAYRKALEINPDYFLAHNNLGTLLQDRGDMEGALRSYENASSLNPNFATPLSNIAYLKKCTGTSDEIITNIIELFENESISSDDEILLSFALGKLFDDCCEYDKAFHNYERGNLLAGLDIKFDIEEHQKILDNIKGLFDQDFFNRLNEFGSNSSRPVFVLGMPRSGTSLVEQIIASHSKASGMGELDYFNHIIGMLTGNTNTIIQALQGWSEIHTEELIKAANNYLAILDSKMGEEDIRIVDKMPYNFLHLGLISALFPNAFIVHCKRNPLDTCLSIYFHYFQGFHNYSYNLMNIGQYFLSYEKLMNHWQDVIRTPMLTVHYEELIADNVRTSQEIIKFIDLSWEDACLEYHNNKQIVQTRSNVQVRQPIYSSSVDRWRHYEKHLSQLMELLS